MAIWKKSIMDSVAADGSFTYLGEHCEVLIDEKRIVISYFDEGKSVQYTGANKNNGHFRVESHQTGGYGSLHKFEDEDILVGYWTEEGYEGFWRFELKN